MSIWSATELSHIFAYFVRADESVYVNTDSMRIYVRHALLPRHCVPRGEGLGFLFVNTFADGRHCDRPFGWCT
jgi:hypothetical protein